MSESRCVLAATDLSAPARHAAERAAWVAQATGAALELVHVASLAPLERLRRLVAQAPAGLEQAVLGQARQALDALAQRLRERAPGLRCGTHVASGALLVELEARAQALSAGLIVLGARGESLARHLLLGSTAERLVGRAQRPMLVVRQAARAPYRTVLVPVDFSAATPAALRAARMVAPGARLVLLHAFDVPFEGSLRYAGVGDEVIREYRVAARTDALARLRALADETGLTPQEVDCLVRPGDATRCILEQEQECDADLVVMGKQGEGRIEALLVGSVTRRVLAEAQGDVLVAV